MEVELRSPNIQRNLSEPQRGSERLVFTSTRKKFLNGPKLQIKGAGDEHCGNKDS